MITFILYPMMACRKNKGENKMKNCIGVILNENLDKKFGSLCNSRPSYMLPYAGRYRLLDFALSNMVNYQINNVVK